METNDHQVWIVAIPRPGTLSFYHFRTAELAANCAEARLLGKKPPEPDFFVQCLFDAEARVISEMKKRYPNYSSIQKLDLEEVVRILRAYWKHAPQVLGDWGGPGR